MTLRGAGPRRAAAALGALLAATLLLTGCVSVPTSGSVEKVQASGQPANPQLQIAPLPPAAGATPELIANGFIAAMAAYQPGWEVAKQYLTTAAATHWQPDRQVLIFSESTPLNTTDTSAMLQARLTGRLSGDGAFSPLDAPLSYDFGMVKQAGEWRISRPPDGLLVSSTNFARFYAAYPRYFFEPQYRSLVPDPVYLPAAANPAAALLQSLLDGPTPWLAPAVRSAIPARTTLNGSSVPVDRDGIADVSLSDTILPLGQQARSLLATQITSTLASVTGITGVRFTVNGRQYEITGAQVGSGADAHVPVGLPSSVAPTDPSTTASLFAASRSGLVSVSGTGVVQAVPGDLGHSTPDITSLAVSRDSSNVAAVRSSTTLVVGSVGSGPVHTVLSHVGTLLRPQYTRFGELWTISRSGHRQRLWLVKDGHLTEVSAPALGADPVTAFRISPDGVRMALVRTVGGHSELGLARLIRGDTTTVLDGWRPVSLSDPNDRLTSVADVGWFDPTTLMILGAAGPTVPQAPYQVAQDSSERYLLGQAEQWNAVALATSPIGGTAVVLGRKGETWRYQERYSWPLFTIATPLRAVAYPG